MEHRPHNELVNSLFMIRQQDDDNRRNYPSVLMTSSGSMTSRRTSATASLTTDASTAASLFSASTARGGLNPQQLLEDSPLGGDTSSTRSSDNEDDYLFEYPVVQVQTSSSNSKKKKKSHKNKGEKKKKKKKSKSKSSSSKRKLHEESSSTLMMESSTSILKDTPWEGGLQAGNVTGDELPYDAALAVEDGTETVWGNDYHFKNEDWGAPKRGSPQRGEAFSSYDMDISATTDWSGGIQAHLNRGNRRAQQQRQSPITGGVPNSLPAWDVSSHDDMTTMSDLQSFVDENMSVLTGDSYHHGNPNDRNTAVDSLNNNHVAARDTAAPAPTHDSSEPIPHELLVNYLLTLGANHDTADELAHNFTAKQQQRQQQQRFAGLPKQAPSTTLSSKLREAEQDGHNRIEYHRQQSDEQSKDSFSFTDQELTGTGYFASTNRIAHIVEARPVRDVATEFPVVYADTSPLSFKYLANERPVRRLFCIVILAMLAAAIFVVVYFIVLKKDASSVPRLRGTMQAPTLSPSLAPTFVTDDILLAAGDLSGFNVLAETSSPQLQAVGWMSTFDQVDTRGLGGQAFAQRYALVVMYYSFEGADWINQENWLSPDLHECEWSSGIVCELDETNARVVTGFDATRNNLQGALPPEIGLLSSSETFRIPKNSVRGKIPGSIGQMTSLSVLDLCENEITGAIPSSLDGARDMILLNLSMNQLSSTIPVELYRLQFLRTLVLTTNQLTGTLHSSINNLSSLATLDLRDNQISGTLPVTLDSIASLDVVRLDHNQLTGSLPDVTTSLVLKQTLGLSHNQFSGNIALSSTHAFPTNTSEMRLQHVDLSYNLLSGPISPLFGFLPTFRYFDLSGNKFAGTFPSAVGWSNIEYLAATNNALTGTVPSGYPTLTHLDMSNNYFSEGIPEDFCTYQDLEFLILSGNPLNSTIPACLGDSSKLRDLELRNCSLTGTIPPSIGRLSDLSILHLSNNLLSNAIPTELGGLTSMNDLQLQGNALTGPIPSELAYMADLNILNLTDNVLTGTFPTELEVLKDLESLALRGNVDLRGEIPSGLCDISTSGLLARDIGCNVACECCSDTVAVCNL